MKFDKLDFELLDALNSDGRDVYHTTSNVAKDVFSDKLGDVELSNLDSRVRSRLDKLCSYGVVVKKQDNRPIKYNLDYSSIVYGDACINAQDSITGNGTEYALEIDKLLFISTQDGVMLCGFVPGEQAPDLDYQ